MTLQARLAAMMTLVLAAVVAVQFVLAERERRELVSRLENMAGELDRSTALFVQRAHEMAALPDPRALPDLVYKTWRDSALAGRDTQVQVLVFADTALAPRGVTQWEQRTNIDLRVEPGTAPEARQGSVTHSRHILWMRNGAVLAAVDSFSADSLPAPRLTPVRDAAAAHAVDRKGDFVINLPLPRYDADSLYSVQVHYSYAGLADELARSRRRSLLWLAAVLGAGVLVVIAVAGQFTRPIRALESSFGRVVLGNLDVHVEPRRRDEIGHLTASFNTMVARLRESQAMAGRLAESEHLASLGRLAAGIAHEIRNPLNAILLNLQQMQERLQRGGTAAEPSRADADKYYGRIATELGRLDQLVGSFLDLAKSGELRFEPIDLETGIRDAVELFLPVAAEKGVALTAELTAPLPVRGDPARLPAVWNNLLANAVQATPAGGRVTVRAAAASGEIRVDVEDTGPGIPPDAQARIWEPFYSRRENGTGLGLAIVRSTVEHHGGTISAAGAPGGGTMMQVVLPRRPGGSETGEPA